MPESLLTSREVAKWLLISNQTLNHWRISGAGPKFIRLSANRIGYRLDDVEAWLAGRAIYTTNEESTYVPGSNTRRYRRR